MARIQITFWDWAILIGYLVAMGAIGMYVARRVKSTDHYFLGKRGFNRWLMVAQSFGVGTHAEMPVSLAGAVYGVGFSAIWFQWKNLFVTPFYWIMAPIFRRYRRSTMAEVFQDRYGAWLGAVYAVFAIIFFTINMGSMVKGAGKVLSQALGGRVAVDEIVIAMTAVFILYSFFGGLVSAAWTDLFQGLLILCLSFMLIPLGWGVVGGMGGMKGSLEAFKFTLAAPQGITVGFILVLTLNGLVGIMAQPHQLAAVGTGRDEHTCRVGMTAGNFIKRFCTIGWALVGLISGAMVVKQVIPGATLADSEEAFGFACRHLLFPGALGLLIASVLAASMAACSAFMVDSGALFTQGFYRKYVVRGRDDRHYLWTGRFSGFAITMAGVVYALFFINKVLYTFLLTETMATFMGISLLGGLLWKRANRWGALASIIAAFTANFALYSIKGQRLDHWDPEVFLWALGCGTAALIVFSFLTPPEPSKQVRDMFARLDVSTDVSTELATPHAAGQSHELEGLEPEQIEELARKTAAAGRASLLTDAGRLWRRGDGIGFLHAYSHDLKGLVWSWVVVAVLITIAWGVLQL